MKRRAWRGPVPLLVLAAIFAPSAILAAPPEPARFGPRDAPQVFSIAKSENQNRVAYALRLDSRCSPAGDAPVAPYWRMLEKGPSATEPLLAREEAAYGIASQSVNAGIVHVTLRALEGRPIAIEAHAVPGGCAATAWTRIGGVQAQLLEVFVQLSWPFGVRYIVLRGRARDRAVEEIIER